MSSKLHTHTQKKNKKKRGDKEMPDTGHRRDGLNQWNDYSLEPVSQISKIITNQICFVLLRNH